MSDLETASVPARAPRAGRYAAIDIGTVTCRMLVADVDAAGTLHELDREYAITNLGEGVDATGMLKAPAMARVMRTLRGFIEVRDGLAAPDAPIETVVVATSAARDANNADVFETLLEDEGLHLRVLSGDEEAALSFKGASSSFPGERIAVVDVGGGSTEIVVGRAGEDPVWAHSFDVGCRRVTEKLIPSDPPSASDLAAARCWVDEQLGGKLSELAQAGCAPDRLVAVAGTATTVVAVHKALEVYDTAQVHGACVDAPTLAAVYDRLRALDTPARARVAGLDPGRAPVIVAGLVILQAVLDRMGFDRFTVSEADILHGIVLDAARRPR